MDDSGPVTTSAPAANRRPPPGRRLSRSLIVSAAIAMADRDGITAVTMRSLGQSLGVEAMSLYRHVNGREDLLEAVTSELVDQIAVDPGAELEPLDGWQSYLQWFAHSVREVALAHPLLFPLVATRHPAAPWLRPPLRSVRVVEQFLDALISRGLEPHQAVATYRSFTTFLLGHLLLETVNQGATTGPAEEPLDESGEAPATGDQDLELADYPTVSALRAQLSEDHTRAEFEQGLEALLDRLDLRLSQ